MQKTTTNLITLITSVLGGAISLALTNSPALAQDEPSEPPLAAWVQVTPWNEAGESDRTLRVVMPAGVACPTPTLGEATLPMRQRNLAPQHASAFPVHVCERILGSDEAVKLGDWSVPPIAREPERILLIGNTGCRIRGRTVQHCDNPNAWPFASLAKIAAELDPDLVIHAGDYHYREYSDAGLGYGCQDTPCGHNFAAWQADFLAPASPLFAKAPWIMVRGNHESCERAGLGWQLFLQRGSAETGVLGPCPEAEKPYLIRLSPEHAMLMLDVAAWNRFLNPHQQDELTALYQGWVAQLTLRLRRLDPISRLWVAVHHPFWYFPFPSDPGAAAVPPAVAVRGGAMTSLRHGLSRLQAALPHTDVDLVLSAGINQLQAIRGAAGSGLPWQLISGGGGTLLDPPADFRYFAGGPDRPLMVEDTPGLVSGKVAFGFVMLVRRGAAWRAEYYDVNGDLFWSCRLSPDGLCR